MKKPVIPAQAGISLLQCTHGIPACAGMTPVFLVITKIYFNNTSEKNQPETHTFFYSKYFL
jgi:hypothetical protein